MKKSLQNLTVALIVIAALAARAELPTARLAALQPFAGQRGSTIDVKLIGQDLAPDVGVRQQDFLPVDVGSLRDRAGQRVSAIFARRQVDFQTIACQPLAGDRDAGEVVAAGASRVVVVRAIRDADDPEAAARALRNALPAASPIAPGRIPASPGSPVAGAPSEGAIGSV